MIDIIRDYKIHIVIPIIVIVSIGVFSYNYHSSDSPNNEQSSIGIDLSINQSYENLDFCEDCEIPEKRSLLLKRYSIKRPQINSSVALDMLDHYNYYNKTYKINITTEWIRIEDEHYSTVVHFQDAKLESLRTSDDTYVPVTEQEIEQNESLYNYSEAFSIAVQYLKKHNLYNDSWQIIENSSIRTLNITTRNITIKFYILRMAPVYNGLPVGGTGTPFISIYINPRGTVLRCCAKYYDIHFQTEYYKTVDPHAAIKSIDNNISRIILYNYNENETLKITKMELVYRTDPDDRSKLVPTWLIYLSRDDGSEFVLTAGV